MRFLRAWWRQILPGAALAVVTPGAILVAALTVGVAGGGLRELGSLTQALTGPEVPSVEPAASRADRDPRRLLERSMPPARAKARARARARARAAGRWAGDAGRAGTEGAGRSPRGGGGGDRGSSPDRPARDPGAQPPAPTPPARPEPGPVRRIGDRVKDVAEEVPLAGEPASDVVDAIVETVESMPPSDAPLLP